MKRFCVLLVLIPFVWTAACGGEKSEEEQAIEKLGELAKKMEEARLQVKKVSSAAGQYYLMTGDPPMSIEALVDRKYITKKDLKDPWKSELSLETIDSPDQPVRVCSFGPNKSSGGDDDICDPEQK